jgi:hypothetical protein
LTRTSAAAGSTGRGEENIRVAGAHTIVENMRHGMAPKEACLDALKRIARNYNNDKARLGRFDINFYALRKDGAYGSATLWQGQRRGARFAVNDGGESRHEDCAYSAGTMKTNAARVFDSLGIRYELREYEVDPDDLSAETVAAKVGLPPEQVFKTLVLRGDRMGSAWPSFPAIPKWTPKLWPA